MYPWHAEMVDMYGGEYEVAGGVGLGVPLDEIWLAACVERPDLVERWLDADLRVAFRYLEAQAELGLWVIWGGGDLAGKGGPIYGPRVFRELVLPRARKLVARCHELGLVYVYRTDGDLWPIEQEFFVESGIDGYGEIDYEAGMDLDRLKARHGERLTFWGNVPCGTILHHGTEAEVVEFTRHIIDVAAPGGGFIVGSSNAIMPGTPARNVMAMVETVRRYGWY
jgi:uroporphyrinogen decarboxylase